MVKHGMNLIDALRAARRIGVTISRVPRSGEIRLKFPRFKAVVANCRRKSAPRSVTKLLIRAMEVGQ